ncbi:MAG TPA: LacI family DNA-binding transcriptional regulator, partial [Microlunatus sp.]|nr:LacI family DNA-binding transcriptional regulator [Microlunatus sp.]
VSRLAPVVGDDGDPDVRPVTIYDVAEAAGVAASTVSRALSKPGRVSFRTAEHVRTVAARLGYRTEETERDPRTDTSLIAMVVADITNPVFYGMIRGAERAARHAGCTMVLAESQESAAAEHEALQRIVPAVDAVILASSRMSDAAIRTLAKTVRVVVLNRLVDQVPSVATDTIQAVRFAADHLLARGHRSLTYLAGPEASWSDGMRWRGVLEASQQLAIRVRRSGPYRPTIAGGREAAAEWLTSPTSAVIAYNDLLAIGFQQGVAEAGRQIPDDVSVIGFDNIRDGELITPGLTTLASPLASLGSAAVQHLLRPRHAETAETAPLLLPSRLVVRGSTGPAR